MTRSDVLRDKIKSSGYKYNFLAKKLNISYYALRLKIDNKSFFNAREIHELCKLLHITSLAEKEYIFFASDVQKKAHKTKKECIN